MNDHHRTEDAHNQRRAVRRFVRADTPTPLLMELQEVVVALGVLTIFGIAQIASVERQILQSLLISSALVIDGVLFALSFWFIVSTWRNPRLSGRRLVQGITCGLYVLTAGLLLVAKGFLHPVDVGFGSASTIDYVSSKMVQDVCVFRGSQQGADGSDRLRVPFVTVGDVMGDDRDFKMDLTMEGSSVATTFIDATAVDQGYAEFEVALPNMKSGWYSARIYAVGRDNRQSAVGSDDNSGNNRMEQRKYITIPSVYCPMIVGFDVDQDELLPQPIDPYGDFDVTQSGPISITVRTNPDLMTVRESVDIGVRWHSEAMMAEVSKDHTESQYGLGNDSLITLSLPEMQILREDARGRSRSCLTAEVTDGRDISRRIDSSQLCLYWR